LGLAGGDVTAEPHPIGAGDTEVQRVQERFERLLGAAVAISAERSLEQVLQRVVDSARHVVEARYAALGVLNEAGDGLTQFVTSGLEPWQVERVGAPPRGRGLLGLVIREGRPIRVDRVERHPQSWGFPPHHPQMTSFLGVPIAGRERVIGNLYLTDKLGAATFSAEDERIAVLLAAQAAVAVENARLYDETSRLLSQLQLLQRQRDQFFAMINHELRNALTGVYGWAEQLVRAKNPNTVARAGREVYESAERTVTLLNNLLDLSRLDAGKVQAVWRQVSLEPVVRRAIQAVLPAADAKSVAIREDYGAVSPVLHTDPLRLEQILINLLSNAVRHGPAGEAVLVRTEHTPEMICVHVIDRGKGIPVEAQDKIFEPYIRVDPDTGLGSGLGLPVSRRLAELLGGRLTVHSALGRGATFTLCLPNSPPSRHPTEREGEA
jgi:signal transduction histidine kinase